MTRSLFIWELYQTDSVLKPGAANSQKPGLKYAAKVSTRRKVDDTGNIHSRLLLFLLKCFLVSFLILRKYVNQQLSF